MSTTKTILAIDPGPTESGWFIRGADGKPLGFGIWKNEEIRESLKSWAADILVLEMIGFYNTGMPVPNAAFDTCIEIGRFIQQWPGEHILMFRKTVVSHLCGTAKAKDANVRMALLNRYGDRADRKGGVLYGVKSHIWSALAIATAYAELSQ